VLAIDPGMRTANHRPIECLDGPAGRMAMRSHDGRSPTLRAKVMSRHGHGRVRVKSFVSLSPPVLSRSGDIRQLANTRRRQT
jgi:hypothetical protein